MREWSYLQQVEIHDGGRARQSLKNKSCQKEANLKLVSTYASFLICGRGGQRSDVIKILLKPNYRNCPQCSFRYPFFDLGLYRESQLEILIKTTCEYGTGHKAWIRKIQSFIGCLGEEGRDLGSILSARICSWLTWIRLFFHPLNAVYFH